MGGRTAGIPCSPFLPTDIADKLFASTNRIQPCGQKGNESSWLHMHLLPHSPVPHKILFFNQKVVLEPPSQAQNQ